MGERRPAIIEKTFLLVGFVIWIYLFFRAAFVLMAHDEIATFFYYIQTGEFLPAIAHWDANNHILNSAIGALFYRIAGDHPLVLRLSNLIFWPVFVIYTILVSRRIENPWLQAGFLATLFTTHSFIEFFALSRGYGISMALMSGALYYLVRYFEKPVLKYLVLLFVANFFTLSANLSLYLLTLVMALAAAYKLFLVLRSGKRKTPYAEILVFTLLFILPSIYFALLLFQMKDRDLLYYGSDAGIWDVTARSVIRLLAASGHVIFEWFWGAVIAFVTLTGALQLAWNKWIINQKLLFFLLFLLTVVAIIMANLVLGINYPEDRVGIYLFPLLTGAYFFIADDMKVARKTLFLVPFVWIPVLFLSSLNLYYSECYKTDLVPEEFYMKVKDSRADNELPATIGGYRTRHFCWSFHDYRSGGTQNQIYYKTYPGSETDFLICEKDELDEMKDFYEPVLEEPVNSRYLMKRMSPVVKEPVEIKTANATNGLINDEYWLVYESFIDSLEGETLQVDFNFGVMSPLAPFESRMVLSIHDRDYKELRYEYLELDWLRKEWTEGNEILRHSLIVHELPPGSYRMRLYLWSIEKEPYRITEGSCKLNILRL